MNLAQGLGLDALVERRIRKAMANGEFDNLPGAGKPLQFDDDPLLPEELRVAYRVLKNSGYVPPEVAQLAEINQLLGAVARGDLREAEHERHGRRLRALLIQLELSGRSTTAQAAWQQYGEALRRRGEEPREEARS